MVIYMGSAMDRDSREIRFSEAQAVYLAHEGVLPEALSTLFRGPPRQVVRVSSKQKDEILSAIGSRLQRVGFDANYDATAEGALLESIVDTLTRPASA